MSDVTAKEIIDVLVDLMNSLHQENIHPDDTEKLEKRSSDLIARLQNVPFGCHCDLEPGKKPDSCVLDEGKPENCFFAEKLVKEGKNKQDCEYWHEIKKNLG